MRRTVIAVGLLATACMRREYGDDGQWATTTNPCVPVGAATTLAEETELFEIAPAGDTILFGTHAGIKQVSVLGGDPVTVALAGSAYTGPLAAIADVLVYYDQHHSDFGVTDIGVVIDRGYSGDGPRYDWIALADEVFGLMVVDSGVHWTERSGAHRFDRRWDSMTGITIDFDLPFSDPIVTNGREFFIRVGPTELATQPAEGGQREVFVTEREATPAAIADDGELYYTLDNTSSNDLVVQPRDGSALRYLVSNEEAGFGVVLGEHYYWTEDDTVYRTHRLTGGKQKVYSARDSLITGLVADACNLYWREELAIRALTPP